MLIYLICFDEHLHHAKHYVGSTINLYERLNKHANGKGAAITRHLFQTDRNWELKRLWIANDLDSRTPEQLLKAQHNSPSYCPGCTKFPLRLAGAMDYDLSLVQETRSEDYRKG